MDTARARLSASPVFVVALVLGLMIFATWNDLRYLGVFEAIGNVLS